MIRLECISLANGQAIKIPEATIVCLGNFDGVHIGHRALLQRANKMRSSDPMLSHASIAVFCFREHPAEFLGNPRTRLGSAEQKKHAFAEEGMDCLILAEFSDLKDLSPKDFVKDILCARCNCVAAVCGFNYRFGHLGSGTAAELKHLLPAPVAIVEEITENGKTVSSSLIRSLLAQGDVQTAARLLRHPYSFVSRVLHGKQLGRTLGFPTINQSFPHGLQVPLYGVYVTECTTDGACYRGVSNVGVRPTVDQNDTVNCETYLLDFSGDLYGKEVTVAFLEFLRPEQKFASVDALREQIEKDIIRARKYQA